MMTMVLDMTAQIAPGIWMLVAALVVSIVSLLGIAETGNTTWQ